MRKPDYCLCENKGADQRLSVAVTVKLISVFVFATWKVQYLLYLYPKCQDSSFLPRIYKPACQTRLEKPGRPVFLGHSSCKGRVKDMTGSQYKKSNACAKKLPTVPVFMAHWNYMDKATPLRQPL